MEASGSLVDYAAATNPCDESWSISSGAFTACQTERNSACVARSIVSHFQLLALALGRRCFVFLVISIHYQE
jgi:hypothetical protein